jgi:hypothetical protein
MKLVIFISICLLLAWTIADSHGVFPNVKSIEKWAKAKPGMILEKCLQDENGKLFMVRYLYTTDHFNGQYDVRFGLESGCK